MIFAYFYSMKRAKPIHLISVGLAIMILFAGCASDSPRVDNEFGEGDTNPDGTAGQSGAPGRY